VQVVEYEQQRLALGGGAKECGDGVEQREARVLGVAGGRLRCLVGQLWDEAGHVLGGGAEARGELGRVAGA